MDTIAIECAALTHALHAFRAALSSHPHHEGLARGELACLVGLGAESDHVRMGYLPFEIERQVRDSVLATGSTLQRKRHYIRLDHGMLLDGKKVMDEVLSGLRESMRHLVAPALRDELDDVFGSFETDLVCCDVADNYTEVVKL